MAKILTFNHHESFLRSLADTGHDFDVVVRYGSLDLGWNKSARPVPSNFQLVDFDDQLRRRLKNGTYDLVVCHTLKNLWWLFPYLNCRYIFIAHIPLFFTTPVKAFKSILKKLFYMAFRLTHSVRFVAVSEFKRRMWCEEGEVVVLTPEEVPPLKDKQGYDRILIIANQIKRRSEELGYEMLQKLSEEFPITVVGNNPDVSFGQKPKDFQDFKDRIGGFRIYLYTITQPFGDGYNTAMLEAMKMGMAVVTLANPSSPIIHGINGLVGLTIDDLRVHLNTLIKSPQLVDQLGAAAKETVEKQFSKENFLNSWNRILQSRALTPK